MGSPSNQLKALQEMTVVVADTGPSCAISHHGKSLCLTPHRPC